MTEKLRGLALAVLVVAASGCGGTDSGPLTPARNIAGTWKTSIPVKVFFDTDFCTPDLSLVASQDWDVTWVITPGADDNSVNVSMSFAGTNWQLIAGCPGAGVVPEVPPMQFTGNVSSTTLTLNKGSEAVGTFTFTTDILQGDLDYQWCMVYCQREYTTGRTLILRRQ